MCPVRNRLVPNPLSAADEARRQLENVEWGFRADCESKGETFDIQLKEALHDSMLSTFSAISSQLLVLGQAYWCLDANESLATASFLQCADWLDVFDESLRIPAGRLDSQGKPLRLMSRSLLEPMVCLALSGQHDALLHVCRQADESKFWLPAELGKSERPAARFSLDLLRLVRGEFDLVGAEPETLPSRASEIPTLGYEALTASIAGNDSKRCMAALADLAASYRKRASSREKALNPWGYGKVAQVATFDALGTALCRIANWRGMDIHVDSRVHPRQFQ